MYTNIINDREKMYVRDEEENIEDETHDVLGKVEEDTEVLDTLVG